MTSTTSTAGSVEATTALLQAELPRLEERQQALEEALVTVTERLESVRTALTALQALTAAPPVPAAAAVAADPESDTSPASSTDSEADADARPEVTPQGQQEPSPSAATGDLPEPEAVIPAPRKARRIASNNGKAAPKAPAQQKKERPSKKAIPAKSEKAQAAQETAPGVTAKDRGRLIEQVMDVVSAAGGTPVRAREVTEALGRELTAGSINTVRSTLDRLVATSKAHRAGRGLYQAPAK
ncbi:hypothetical protein [Streptomyces atratus]|uniref:hypothetical protein n=1 Tax=Streptomyces atratus TaxID=1893 RepID=UPI0033CBD4D3